MKKLLLAAALMLLPATAFAQTPFDVLFTQAAGRLGLQPEAQAKILRFAGELRDDVVVDYAVHSVYPPVVDIVFASGREIHAAGDMLRLARYDYDNDYLIFEDYAGLCITIFVLGYILLWVGFFSLSLSLAITGVELMLFVLALCL